MPLLAVTAYEGGQATVALVPLGISVALLVVGVRRRRAARTTPAWGYVRPAAEAPGFAGDRQDPSPTSPSWTRLPELEPSAGPVGGLPADWSPPTTARSGATGLIVSGAALSALTLLGGAIVIADRAGTHRTVALPTSVLGLARDEAASAQVGKQALADVPTGLTDPQAAVYGTLPNAVLVIAARAHTSQPGSQLEGFRKGIENSGGTLTNGRDVSPGPLGGAARCWQAALSGGHPGVCVFVDAGWLVATVDFLGGGLDAAAKRGRQVREATVTKR
ncbi:MAG: hypothetical protein NVS3B26_04030 [Mycobacteriales bacterium]